MGGKTKTVVVVAFVVSVILASALLYPFSLLPGPEGAKVGLYSVQDPLTLVTYVIGESRDPDAAAFPVDPMNVRYDPDASGSGYPDFYIDLSKVWSENEVLDKEINYWVSDADGWHHVTGKIHVSYFNIVFRAEPSGDAGQPPPILQTGQTEYEKHWKSGAFWLATGTTVWNNAVLDPSVEPNVKYGHVWSAPLSAYIIQREEAPDCSTWNYLNPDIQVGRQVTLFDSPSGGSIIDTIGNMDPATSDLNSTVYNSWTGSPSPDSRMSQIGYFVFEPTDFGVEWWYNPLFGYKTPKLQATVKVYYLVIGDFIYTQQEYQEWILGESKHTYSWYDYLRFDINSAFAGFGAWLTNPLNQLLAAAFMFLVIIGLGALVLFWIAGSPAILRRKR